MQEHQAQVGAVAEASWTSWLRRRGWDVGAALVVLWAGFWLLLATFQDSATTDEFFHLTRGLYWWVTGNTKLSYGHPPVANLLAAIPGSLMGVSASDLLASPAFPNGAITEVASNYVRSHWPLVASQLLAGRLVIGALALLSLVYFYQLVAEFLGKPTAFAAVLLCACHPLLLAHGHLVTTDFAAFGGMLLVFGEGTRYLTRRGWAIWLRYSLVLGMVVCTKYSTAPFVALGLTLPVVLALLGRAPRFQGTRWLRGRTAALEVVLAGLVVVLSIHAIYRFQGSVWTMADLAGAVARHEVNARAVADAAESFLRAVPPSLPIPLPRTFVWGLAHTSVHNSHGHSTWFWGETYSMGKWYYFPLLFVLKTPLVHHLTFLAGVGALASVAPWRRGAKGAPLLWVMVGGCSLFLLLLTRANLNIGVRHALPLVLMLSLVGAVGCVALGARVKLCLGEARQSVALAVASIPLVWAATVPITAFPDPIGYFTELLGRERGHNISMVAEDWGQDVYRLSAELKRLGVSRLNYDGYTYAANLELADRGFQVRDFDCRKRARPGEVYAIHGARYVRLGACQRLVRGAKLLAIVSNHIRVYQLPEARQKPGRSARTRGTDGEPLPKRPSEVDPAGAEDSGSASTENSLGPDEFGEGRSP